MFRNLQQVCASIAFAEENEHEFALYLIQNNKKESIFKKLYNSMNNESILITYSAKGIVKRRLKNIGFQVETLPGPPGKREITRAIKY